LTELRQLEYKVTLKAYSKNKSSAVEYGGWHFSPATFVLSAQLL